LLSFRLALLCYASVKIFITELTNDSITDNNDINSTISIDGNNNIHNATDNAVTNNAATNNVVIERASGKKCSLCIDALKNPSCTPCGHIYCWECIMRCCSQQHIGRTGTLMNTDSSNNLKVKCPKCRREFLPQSVRPLYNY
jgi:peroxin-10